MLNFYGTMERRPAPPTTVTWPTHSVSFEDKFHYAVLSGKLGKIRDIFSRGISVDCYNEDGQTALFCAAFKGVSSVVALLLSLGAKPNARCHPGGYTPVHGACYAGCPQILKLILQAGGDLRLCDNQRKTPVCWCLLQPDPMKVDAIRNVIEGARICVMQTSGVEMLKEMQISLSPRSNRVFFETVRNMLKMSSRNRYDMNLNLEELATGIHYTGFGKVYFGSGQRCASVIGLPYISDVSELDEEENKDAPSWLCGKFTSFNPRQWTQRRTPVSTRELYKMAGPHCIPDILITELEVRSKLHHPNLLMLLGVCQTNKCDSVSLVFERIKIGSLYSVLHFESERKPLSSGFATDIIIQICEALEYVHSLDIVHCAVTSHSIMLVNTGQAKLSCFEYALPDNARSEEFMSWRHPILTSDAHLGVLRHWMAPEVLLKQQFSVRGDIYSLASVMWELCSGEVPWQQFSLQALRQLFSQTQEKLTVNKKSVSPFWCHLLDLGLTVRRDARDLDLEEIREMMVLSKKPQSVQSSEMGSLYGSRHVSAASVVASSMKYPEAGNIEVVDGVDVADYYGTDGQVYRSTSYSSLPENHPSTTRFLEATPPTGHRNNGAGEYPKLSKYATFSGADKTVVPPQGILKKFKVVKQLKKDSVSTITSNKATCTTEAHGPVEKETLTSRNDQNPLKVVLKEVKESQTQTEQVSPEQQFTPPGQVDDRPAVDEGPPKKPERMGAIMKLGLTCRSQAKLDNKNMGTQTEGRGIMTCSYNGQKQQQNPRILTSPSLVASPTNASTPLWSSFNSGSTTSGPIVVLDAEAKAARRYVKEKLNAILELRNSVKGCDVDESKKFYSLQLPKKKASAIKPASHTLEGVAPTTLGEGDKWTVDKEQGREEMSRDQVEGERIEEVFLYQQYHHTVSPRRTQENGDDGSMHLPKKHISPIKPASHSLEGVLPTALGEGDELAVGKTQVEGDIIEGVGLNQRCPNASPRGQTEENDNCSVKITTEAISPSKPTSHSLEGTSTALDDEDDWSLDKEQVDNEEIGKAEEAGDEIADDRIEEVDLYQTCPPLSPHGQTQEEDDW